MLLPGMIELATNWKYSENCAKGEHFMLLSMLQYINLYDLCLTFKGKLPKTIITNIWYVIPL